MAFRERLDDPQRRLLIHTFVPPPRSASRTELDAVAQSLERLRRQARLDAVHLPQVRPDPRSPRPRFVPKLAPRAFARAMDRRLDTPPDWLLNRAIRDYPWAQHATWLRRTIEEQGDPSLVLAGGAPERSPVPGPFVTEATRRIRAADGDRVRLGGIAVPDRRDESERLLAKTEAGIDFFITQILGEGDSTCRLIADYHRLCLENGCRPRPLILSVAPVSGRRDVAFLEAWGVQFDPRGRRALMGSSLGIGWRSIDMAIQLLHRVAARSQAETLGVPLGANVEHVRPHNLELSAELLKRVSEEWS
ncbi:MAG: hypothetical protein ABEK03_10020 [Candidatus Bipolaricaulia bacterium]